MNFNEWKEKYYPDLTNEDTLHKMSHAYASGHVNKASNSVPREQHDRVVGLLRNIWGTVESMSDIDKLKFLWLYKDEVEEIKDQK